MKWTAEEAKKLFALRKRFDCDFRSPHIRNEQIWKIIAAELHTTPRRCGDKLKYEKSRYTAVFDNRGAKGTGASPMKCDFFNELHDIFGG